MLFRLSIWIVYDSGYIFEILHEAFQWRRKKRIIYSLRENDWILDITIIFFLGNFICCAFLCSPFISNFNDLQVRHWGSNGEDKVIEQTIEFFISPHEDTKRTQLYYLTSSASFLLELHPFGKLYHQMHLPTTFATFEVFIFFHFKTDVTI